MLTDQQEKFPRADSFAGIWEWRRPSFPLPAKLLRLELYVKDDALFGNWHLQTRGMTCSGTLETQWGAANEPFVLRLTGGGISLCAQMQLLNEEKNRAEWLRTEHRNGSPFPARAELMRMRRLHF